MVCHRGQEEFLSDLLWGSVLGIWKNKAKHMRCLKSAGEAYTSLSLHGDYIWLSSYTYGETASQRSQGQGHTPQTQPDLDLSVEVLNFHTNPLNHLIALPSRASQAEFQIINSYVIPTLLVNHSTPFIL